MPDPVGEFVQRKVLPEFHDIVAELRELMRKYAPHAEEVVTYGIPAWKGNRILAVISPTKNDITFAFSNGADFVDKYGLLKGVGKRSKHVKIQKLEDINREAFRYYIKQAVERDAP